MAAADKKSTYTAAEVAELIRPLADSIALLKEENAELKRKLEHMNEVFANAQRARFGQSSEKNTYVLHDQASFFNEAEKEQAPKAEEPTPDTILVEAHQRKKRRSQAEMLNNLPEKEVLLELPEDQLICGKCGGVMKPIGKKFLRHEMQIIPKQINLLAYYAVTYACDSCEKDTGFAHIATVKPPAPLMKHSLASASTVAYIPNDRENWAIFENVHEPTIDRAVWEQVQEKRGKIRRRKPKDGERNMFGGLLICADCGHNLNYHFNQGNHDIKYFNCSNYNSGRGSCTSTHYIRVDFLEQVVLGEIKRLTKYAMRYEDEFQQAIMGSTQKAVELERKLKQKELAAAQARDNELDGLFERIYEDNISGKLSDERFAKMSQRYEEEQAELSEKIKALRKELDKLSGDAVSTDMFLSTVRKYTRAKKLTPRMLNELVNHIEVHQAEKINGEWVQKLTIHYNCVGALFIPDTPSMPVPDVTVNTRRGVYVSYEPAQNGQ